MREGFRFATDEERKALGIPPAYTDVMVAIDPKSRLVAVAKTPKGKTFYRYAKSAVERNTTAKYKRIARLAQKLDRITARIERDVERGVSEAYCARLILLTGMRNGNPPQGDKPSFGASSRLLKHVQGIGDVTIFDFPGKHGVMQHYEVHDKVIADYVLRRQKSVLQVPNWPEERLFVHSAGDTLRYLKKAGAEKVHDLRTLRANVLARVLVEQVLEAGRPSTKKELKAIIKYISTAVASTLGNKPGQALKSYIDPSVLAPLHPDEGE